MVSTRYVGTFPSTIGTPIVQASKLRDHPVLVGCKPDPVDRDVDFTTDLQDLEPIMIRDFGPEMNGLQGRRDIESFDFSIVVWNH